MENRRQRPAVILFFLAAAVAAQSQAQWSTTSTTDPTYRAGAVGIGTAANPTAKLEIKQSVDTVGGSLRVIRSNTTDYAEFYIGGDNQAYIQVNGGSAYLTLQSGGNVGIGTTGPADKLDVNGSIRLSANNTYINMVRTDGAAVSTVLARNDNQLGLRSLGSGIQFDSRVGAALMNIADGGNVGIGTTGPNDKLDVNGNIRLTANNTYINMVRTDGAAVSTVLARNDNQLGLRSLGSGIQFDSRVGAALMNIADAGNVGIGTAGPLGKLVISSSNGPGSSTGDLVLQNPTAFADGNSRTAAVSFKTNNPASLLGYESASIRAVMTPSTGITTPQASLQFWTADNSLGLTERMRIAENGNVGIGTGSAAPSDQLTVGAVGDIGNKVTVNGSVTVTGNIAAKFQDIAEWVPVAESMPPGTVVVVSNDASNTVTPSLRAYDTGVAGVISAQPGLTLGEGSATKAKVATTGRVKVRVDASAHPIARGDLLVTSDKPGTAMFSEALDLGGVKIHRPGTLIGKALEPLATGQGEILVLLSLQ